jgi:hemoglobin
LEDVQRHNQNMIDHPSSAHPWGDEVSPYIEIGGEEGVRRLSETFYDIIEEESPILRAILPRNTTKTRQKFYMYLSGWLGGPPLYEMKWGHPRLKMRHNPFKIGDEEAAEWMRCMGMALERAKVAEPLTRFLTTQFEGVALHMRNQ